jgi:ATP phosphoribosyltransferase regulatory subunit
MQEYKKHTPEGCQDYLFDECFIKKNLENKLKKVFKSCGYFEIETPTLEFYDVFGADKDIIATETMFKFFDAQGRILVLRPDMTVPIARVAATKLRDSVYPMRISYCGKSFRFRELTGGGQRETTEGGIELFGLLSPEADAEVIAAAINSLTSAGLENFQIDIGQVEFFKGLMEEGNFTESEIETIRVFIDKKDMLGVEQIIKEHEISDNLKEIIMNLPAFFGSVDIIDSVKKMDLNARSMKALCYLEKVLELIDDYGLSRYISIDLGMVQRLNYYSGIIFRGFTYGVGFPILSGGRYDTLVGKYGEECPAVGFSVNINMLMTALERQKIELSEPVIEVLVTYTSEGRKAAFNTANTLRELGSIVEINVDADAYDLDKIILYAGRKGINRIIHFIDSKDVEIYRIEKNEAVKFNATIDDVLNGEGA